MREGPRFRHDGFTPKKREAFLKAFGRSACVTDAARIAGVSRNTVGRWRDKDPEFAAAMETARALAAGPLERLAYERATIGARETVIRDGKVVAEKIKPSDAMLRLLLQGARPGKYGRLSRGGETKKQIEKRLRKQIEAELRGEAVADPGEVAAKLEEEIDRLLRGKDATRRAAGWQWTEDGDPIPPGWVRKE